jgi:DNA-binding transcriptional MocR family regulator
MFVWADYGRDTEALARVAADHGMLLAPGTLFSPSQAPSTMLRFSVTIADHRGVWTDLEKIFAQNVSSNQ